MTDQPTPPPESDPPQSEQAESDWERKRRLAEVFGDVLPETTSDERDSEGDDKPSSDAWLKAQVPPHHG